MTAQILALIIFLAMFVLIILEIWDRHLITLGCGLLTLILVFGFGMHSMNAVWETLNVKSIFTTAFWYAAGESSEASSGINWQTIIFIAGMMIMVEGMARVGFFRWLCMRLAKLVKYQVIPIFVTFMVLSFVLAMFIDSITVILFLAAVTIELSKLLEFNPVPMILSEIFCANLGGSATMCGDPPNIIIGTSLGFTFMDFIKNTGLIAVVALVLVVVYFYFIFHKELEKNGAAKKDPSQYPDPAEAITSKSGFIASSVIFLCAVVLLVTHAQTGLTVSTIGVCIAAATLLAAGKEGPGLLKKIDYETLLFFIGLFVVVGGLEQTGVLKILAGIIEKVSGGNIALMIAIIVIVSAVASAFIDNIPFAATMIPVITNLAATTQGIDITVLSWALAMGTDIGGSATPIGASANVVGIATAAKEGHIIKWGRYCKAMAPATAIVIAVSLVMIYVRYL
ncbi:MAG: citrate transporter [Lachnospiraceae bacterium]|uniref:SLC13 family permease n=1 Tax=Blautia sp. OF03-15BH TaxID=2292287 RepID=UPI000E5185F1|nr:SLC13 family permease [Blautia sp. OF03-15BH]MBD9013300.1 citrate transporter [Lachnospiraceae bacterium]RGX97257.1 citrate transporter [Blautia sp. OF03-15BH]